MLTIETNDVDFYNEETNNFITLKKRTIDLEHSLVSLSKWESKWCKPFLGKGEKTDEELRDYVRCMTITRNVPVEVYYTLSNEMVKEINDYIEHPMTATTFSDSKNQAGTNEIITSELIYYWMIALNIPFECQKWHLNRLLTLVRVCGIKSTPAKKMSKNALLSRNAAINAARRKQLNTKG